MYLYAKVVMSKPTYERFKERKTLGKVSHITPLTVQIMTRENEYLTITDITAYTGPNVFGVKNFHVEALDLRLGMQVIIADQQLRLEDVLIIDYSQTQSAALMKIVFPENKHGISIKIQRTQRADWYVKKKIELQMQPHTHSVRMLLEHPALLVRESRKAQNQQTLRELLQQFVGLGTEAVPSGDAFLLGMAYVAALEKYPNLILPATLRILAPVIQVQTNPISAAKFLFALRGEVSSEIAAAVQAIISDEQYSEVETQIRGILMIEDNSGFDVLTGIIAGFQIALS